MAALPKTITLHRRRPDLPRHPRRRRRRSTASCSPRSATCIAEETATGQRDVVIAGHAGVPFIETSRPRRAGSTPASSACRPTTARRMSGTASFAARAIASCLSTHRLAYDHHGAAAAMRRCGHANGYARTLVTGLWPSLDVFPPAERAATGQRVRSRTRVCQLSRERRQQANNSQHHPKSASRATPYRSAFDCLRGCRSNARCSCRECGRSCCRGRAPSLQAD